MFIWERFRAIAPKLEEFPNVKMGEVVSTDGRG